MQVLFTKKSRNRKTGPIPVTTQESNTCPNTCPQKDRGCYPRFSFTGMQWKALDAGKVGISWKEFLAEVRKMAEGQLWRFGVAGDLPGKGNRINKIKLQQLIDANRGKRAIIYSHKPLTKANQQMISGANEQGLTINLSADSLKDAEKKAALQIGPVVMTMPEDPSIWPTQTKAGQKIVPCPAVTHEGVTCMSCGLCARGSRKVIIGFPAHGTGKRMVEEVFFAS